MIRSIVIASAIILGTVSAEAAGLDSIERQAGIYEGLRGRSEAGAVMFYRSGEGRAATTYESRAGTYWGRASNYWGRPANTGIPRNESILGK